MTPQEEAAVRAFLEAKEADKERTADRQKRIDEGTLVEEPGLTVGDRAKAVGAGALAAFKGAVPEALGGTGETLNVGADIFKGIGSGAVIGTAEGVATLAAIPVDLIADTNYSRDVAEFADKVRDVSGLDPETGAGEVAELISTFAVAALPAVGWMSKAGKAAQAAKASTALTPVTTAFGRSAQSFGQSRLGQTLLAPQYSVRLPGKAGKVVGGGLGRAAERFQTGVQTSLATGMMDFVVAPDGITTLADHFDALPQALRTERDKPGELTGREDALRRLRNKFRIGTEAAALGVAVGDVAIPAVGAVLGATGRAAGAGRRVASNIPVTSNQTLGEIIDTSFARMGQKAGDTGLGRVFKRYFTASRGLLPEIQRSIDDAGGSIGQMDRMVISGFEQYHNAALDVYGRWSNLWGKGKEKYQDAYNLLTKYLEGDKEAFSQLPAKERGALEPLAVKMADKRDELSGLVQTMIEQRFKDGLITAEQYRDVMKAFKAQDGQYLRRVFQKHIGDNELEIQDIINNFGRLEKSGRLPKKFKLAVQEVMGAMKRSKAPEYASLSDREIQEAAIRYTYDNVRKSVADGEVPFRKGTSAEEAAVDRLAASVKPGIVDKLSKTLSTVFEEPQATLKVREGALKPRSTILDEAPTLRTLMGEVTGTKQGVIARYYNTMSELTNMAVAGRLYDDLANNPALVGTAEDILERGGRPSLLPAAEVELLKARARELVEAGDPRGTQILTDIDRKYTQLVGKNESTNTVLGGDFGSLSGMYARSELTASLTNRPYAQTIAGTLMTTGSLVKSLQQQAVVTYNPVAAARNVLGSVFFLTANGLVPRGGDIMDAIGLSMSKIGHAATEEAENFLNMLSRTRILSEGVRDSEIAETLKVGLGRETEKTKTNYAMRVLHDLSNLMSKTTDDILGAEVAGEIRRTGKKVLKTPYSAPQRLQQASDEVGKIAGVVGEMGRMDAALRAAFNIGDANNLRLIDDDLYEELAPEMIKQGVAKRQTNLYGDKFRDVFATDTVTDMYPSYFRVVDAGRLVIRTPIVGTFAGFFSESVRTAGNIIGRAAKEMNFKPTEEMAETFAKRIAADKNIPMEEAMVLGRDAASEFAYQINSIGTRRLGGFSTTTFGISAGLEAASKAAHGISDEQDAQIKSGAVPYYLRGQKLVYLGPPKDGRVQVMPVEYYLPQGIFSAALGTVFQRQKEGVEFGESDLEALFSGVLEGSYNLLRPFTDESLLAERLLDVTARRGKTLSGRIIYRDSLSADDRFGRDNATEKFVKSMQHLAGGITPVALDMFVDVVPERGVVKGRFMKALDQEPTASGVVLDPYAEGLAMTFGARTPELDGLKSLLYSSVTHKKDRNSGLVGEANSEARRMDTTPLRMNKAYYAANMNLFDNQQALLRSIESARSMGATEEQIKKILFDSGLSQPEQRGIKEGFFVPTMPSTQLPDQRAKRLEDDPRLRSIMSKEEYNRYIRTLMTRAQELYPNDERIGAFNETGEGLIPLNGKVPSYEDLMGPELLLLEAPELSDQIEEQSSVEIPELEQPQNIAALELPSAPAPATMAPAAATQSNVSPELLGDNPIEQARNSELANRLRGQS